MTDPRSKTYTCRDCGTIYDGGEDHVCPMKEGCLTSNQKIEHEEGLRRNLAKKANRTHSKY
jgi:hypothetical protein